MTIINIMVLVGLFGLAMHLQLYWLAAFIAAVFGAGILVARRAARRSSALPPESG